MSKLLSLASKLEEASASTVSEFQALETAIDMNFWVTLKLVSTGEIHRTDTLFERVIEYQEYYLACLSLASFFTRLNDEP